MMKIDMSLWNDGSHKWKPPAKNENHCLIFMELSRFYLTRTWNDLPSDMRIHIRQIFRKTFENVIQLAYHHIFMHCDHGLIGQNTATPGPHELENWLNLQILLWRKKSWLAYSIYVINNDESIDKNVCRDMIPLIFEFSDVKWQTIAAGTDFASIIYDLHNITCIRWCSQWYFFYIISVRIKYTSNMISWSGFSFTVFESCFSPRSTSYISFFVRLFQAGSDRDI